MWKRKKGVEKRSVFRCLAVTAWLSLLTSSQLIIPTFLHWDTPLPTDAPPRVCVCVCVSVISREGAHWPPPWTSGCRKTVYGPFLCKFMMHLVEKERKKEIRKKESNTSQRQRYASSVLSQTQFPFTTLAGPEVRSTENISGISCY